VGDEIPFRRQTPEDDGQALSEVIATFPYRHDAEYARGFLDDAEIDSVLSIPTTRKKRARCCGTRA
jgi:hypothetical protein